MPGIHPAAPRTRATQSLAALVLAALILGIGFVLGHDSAFATHFRGTSLTWTKGSGNIATFKLSATYRWSYGWTACDGNPWSGANPPVGKTVNPGVEAFDFGDGSAKVSVCLTVTSTDATEDIMTGTMTLTHTYSGPGPWTASSGGCCSLSTLQDGNHDTGYRAHTVADLAHATASPVSTLPAVIFCPQNPPCDFTVPATDPDGLPLRYRFATVAEDTDPGNPPPNNTHPAGTSIDASGNFSWTGYGALPRGLYSVQLVVEAYNPATPGTPTVADTTVSFILDITSTTNRPPAFDSPPTPADGTVFTVVVNNPVTFGVSASDPDTGDTVTLGIIGVPSDATFTSTAGNPATGTFSWTPMAAGSVILNLTAEDQFGLGATTRSVTIHVLRATPMLSTQASAPVTIGGTISDQATLAGGFNPGGTITFKAYGPADATCAGPPAFTSAAIAVSGGGSNSGPFTPTVAGTYNFVSSYSGDANNIAVTSACGAANESVVVAKATPTLSTQASTPVTIGGTISDQATLTAGFNPGGTITFTVFGPANPTCTGTPAFTSAAGVSGGGANSGPFSPAAPGTYTFVASYSGDANNAAAGPTACNDTKESVVVAQAAPTLVTTASPSVPVGGTITDTAFLTAGVAPTGTVTFNAYGPIDPGCTSPPAFTSSATVSGNGPYASAPFTATLAGTYNFVAVYSGDANNNGVSSACGASGESVVVTKAAPALKTQASSSVPAGGTITDTATLAAGVAPTGTITFNAYGPNDASCTSPAIFTSTVPVSSGNGNYTSGMFTPTAVGTYRWIASYNGDTNNNAATSACNDVNESVVVTPAATTLVTTASGTVPVGGTISDSAVLSGGVAPTGTITFTAYGPNNAGCTSPPAFTSSATVSGNNTYNSDPFTATAIGTYNFVAVYSGDANNAGATSSCGAANESVVVTKATPTLSTQASTAITIGGTISDQATLTGGFNPGGTITFTAYGPNNATCAAPPAFTSAAIAVSGGGANSGPFTPTTAGTYRWVASYSGDTNNTAVSGACNDANESVLVKQATPALSTQASATVVIGGTISDTATLSGGVSPTGTITFKVFGPNNATCTGMPAFTATATVSGNGSYLSGPFTPTAAGTYTFVAVYSGDANNAAAGPTACNDPNESVLVTQAPTSTTVSCAPNPVAVNAPTTCTATVKDTRSVGATQPTGTVSFTTSGGGTFASNSCTLAPAGSDSANCSVTYTPTAPGDQTITATYGGDSAHTGSSGTTTEHVNKRPTTTTVSCSMPIVPQGLPTTCTATVKDTGAAGASIVPTGTVSFSSSGAGTFTGSPCTLAPAGPDSARCTVTYTPTALGDQTVTATYGGDSVHLGSSGTTTITVVPFAPGGGAFVIGDLNNTPNASVNFWGAQWAKNNSTSSGSSVASFKGFADTPVTPSCGGSWSTAPGNSSKPPSGPLPPLMAVIVTSTYSKSGSTISGTVLHIVIVKTDAGYDSNPGHDGTGTIVEQYC